MLTSEKNTNPSTNKYNLSSWKDSTEILDLAVVMKTLVINKICAMMLKKLKKKIKI